MTSSRKLRVAFIHPDLGIGGAERLMVDAALGIQALGHSVDVYTSYHDPNHCFDETRDGRLKVHHVVPLFPRAWNGMFHILFAHARQLHLTQHILRSNKQYDVFFVDQLSTCIPLLRTFSRTRVVFYCHFPDKLLASGMTFMEGQVNKKQVGLLKAIYRFPMDWLEEITTTQADIILANSKFSANVSKTNFHSLQYTPHVVYPGINIEAYLAPVDLSDPDISQVTSSQPTFLSLNRFEMKKNAALAINAFAHLRRTSSNSNIPETRLVVAGGYDPRIRDNIATLESLINLANSNNLTYNVITPKTSRVDVSSFMGTTLTKPDIIFLLSFATAQRSALLQASSTIALLYTPTNEHFGIGPVEGMICGLPVLACNSGGPTESVVDQPEQQRTGWSRPPDPVVWGEALGEICALSEGDRKALATRARDRAQSLFAMDSMAKALEKILQEVVAKGPVPRSSMPLVPVFVLAFIIALLAWYWTLPSV
ncbi:glycosyltransferase family 4 protein [Hygrophoropsis aurantiaca]|uniref:Glycosyltransferase family 4 protein n=1 Tax=Hygrophoropsis aurantiaca TaxID=72124 RepID=A0ACB8AEP8_9AGAM|nr:glycosyltransferase family 4 protein [Hygrophoropsis aurantiaca]